MNANDFQVNQQVKAKGEAVFVILAFRTIAGGSELFAQVKEINPKNGKPCRGEFSLPVSVLRVAA